MISKSIQLITSIIFIGVGIIAGTYAIYKVTNYGIGNLETANTIINIIVAYYLSNGVTIPHVYIIQSHSKIIF